MRLGTALSIRPIRGCSSISLTDAITNPDIPVLGQEVTPDAKPEISTEASTPQARALKSVQRQLARQRKLAEKANQEKVISEPLPEQTAIKGEGETIIFQ